MNIIVFYLFFQPYIFVPALCGVKGSKDIAHGGMNLRSLTPEHDELSKHTGYC